MSHPIISRLGLDRAVGLSLLSRLVSVGGGLVTLYFIATFLSAELQGYLYTFNSLLALQIFAELGLGYAIIQFASHEMAHLTLDASGVLSGDDHVLLRLKSLLRFIAVWFGAASLLLVLVLVPAGWAFLGGGSKFRMEIDYMVPWLLLVISTAGVLFLSGVLSLLEGCNRVADASAVRLLQLTVSLPVMWMALGFGAGLYAPGLASLASALAGWALVVYRHRGWLHALWTVRSKSTIDAMDWRHEIWPFQWRIALSWVSGYFIFQVFSPLLFASQGPVQAGQMGMGMQILTAINSLAIIWVSTRVPLFGQLIARQEQHKLDSEFKSAFWRSLIVLCGCLVVLLFACFWIGKLYPYYAARILPFGLMAGLCVIALMNHVVTAQAMYLRAHKQEPFLVLSLINAVATSALATLLIPSYGLEGAVLSYGIPQFFVALLGGSWIFVQFRRKTL